ncbi:MAG: ATP-binding protein [Marinilabiliaceae bacterium]|jgi:nitrogen fixation/metabolism regulation signal transduction histidine kinase|nr:ATP-binding protein [Marinilabiliaceae bacterium]
MEFNRFAARTVALAVMVSLSGVLFLWTLGQDYLLIAKFSSGIFWIGLLIYLISSVNKTNRSLNSFLQSIRNMDSSRPAMEKDSGIHSLLDSSYNEIIGIVQEIKISREEEYQYFRSLADVSGTGMIVFDDNESIEFLNRTAREIFGIETIGKLGSFDKYASGFASFTRELEAGYNKLFRSATRGELVSLATRKSYLKKGNLNLTLITVQNIHGVIEEQELIVWQKLINVLTHEIMNSVSPIKSLSGTLTRKLKSGIISDSKGITEIIEGLEAIDRRSKGLMQFVESYQRLSKIPEPVFQEVNISDLTDHVISLLSGELVKAGITLKNELDCGDLHINIDERLVSQVLINLIQNSIFALEKSSNKHITIRSKTNYPGKFILEVCDKGTGIPEEILDKIFIPFFTTRENGSGIGLSLARQIMSMHNGSVRVNSGKAADTVFSLCFNY